MMRLALDRRTLLGASLLAGLALPLSARAADTNAAVAPIQRLCDGLLAVMRDGRSMPFAQRAQKLAPAVESAFDLPAILQLSVGPVWGSLPQTQRQILFAAFRRYTIASYVSNFDDYDGQRFEVSPQVRELGNGEQVVTTKLVAPSGTSHELDYVMRQTPQGWRAVDVLADGTISRVAVQRSDFRDLLASGGAPALAKSLQTKTANLSDETG